MKKKLASVLLCAVMAASMLTGCGNADNATATTPATDNKTDAAATTEAAEKTAEAAGSVYYLNFKPEVDEVWQKLAKEYIVNKIDVQNRINIHEKVNEEIEFEG